MIVATGAREQHSEESWIFQIAKEPELLNVPQVTAIEAGSPA
jgi:hypothetical protein